MIWIWAALMLGLMIVSFLNFSDASRLFGKAERLNEHSKFCLDEAHKVHKMARQDLERAKELLKEAWENI